MKGLIPFNQRRNSLMFNSGLEDFYNMLDDFFKDNWVGQSHNLLRESFKLDIEEKESEYLIEAELPGIKREEIELGIEGDNLCISVNCSKEISKDEKNYIHRERQVNCMRRKFCLVNAQLGEAKAKLEEGILVISIPKKEKADTPHKINIE